ncbi:HAD hydrolase family protein [Mycoplasmopsis ciconiae]|uniref:HAD hydrolase family protein n=1 Tax=Mycoplasmopsis ciconiae TaxID=561067 RepID=A0ABU7MLQ8_9BACT|nr:HAD hydrolase family protein [Mycoplasmopsis ciconiae]
MEKIKVDAIFIDLDGTTLDESKGKIHQASEFTKKYLQTLNKQIPVVISTGRGMNPRQEKLSSL